LKTESLLINRVEVTTGSDEEKANILGKYFASVFRVEGNNDDYNKLPSKTTKYPGPNLNFSKEKILDKFKLKDIQISWSRLNTSQDSMILETITRYKLYLKFYLD